ncbi:hypothetical protein [Streptomyces sp. HPF1205]|uniref:hypothetical protein n=1 Tax=Streptomyces sp. HPF1205 TaxID=2873262 RepID=UPI001CEC44FF|nr:hypothetical protein [Streptomyces sp. HPF1205]
MTNTPGWATPGSSGSSEPDAGDSSAPSSTPDPGPPSDPSENRPPASDTGRGTDPGATPPKPEAEQATREDAPQSAAEGPGSPQSGWSRQQPPPVAGWARWTPPSAPPAHGGPRWGSQTPGGGWQAPGAWSRPAAPKPGVIPLRPLGAGEILDGAIATLRLHWRAVIGVTFAIALVTQAVAVVVQGLWNDDDRLRRLQDNPDPSVGDIVHALGGTMGWMGLAFITVMIGWCTATAFLTLVISRAVLGRPVAAAEVRGDATPRVGQLFGLALLLPFIGAAVLAVSVLPGALVSLAGAADGGAALASLGLLGGFVVLVWLLVQWSLAAPALMLEKQGIAAAMKRSAKLVRGDWWRVLGVQLLGLLLSYLVTAFVSLPFTLLSLWLTGDGGFSGFLSGDSSPSWSFLILSGVGAVIASTLTLPISAGVTGLLYMDQRIRRESLDLQLIQAAKDS